MTLDQTIGDFFKYILVGIFNTISCLGIIFFCMYYLELSLFISNAFGYAVTLVNSYFMNIKWTFTINNTTNDSFVKFIIIFFICFALQFLVLSFLISIINFNVYLSQMVAMIIYTLASFTGHRLYTFKQY